MINAVRPRAEVLLGTDKFPMVVRRRFGGGKTAAVNAEGIWRWSLDRSLDSNTAARFWRQLVKGLVRRQAPPLAADRPRYRQFQEATISVSNGDEVSVQSPNGTTETTKVENGRIRLELEQAGLWTISQLRRPQSDR